MEPKKLSPRDLEIIWSKDKRYWRFLPVDDSKEEPVEEFAELVQVCWLEVSGEAEVVPNKTYKIWFTVSMTPDAFGWNSSPVFIMAKGGKNEKYKAQKVNLAGREPGVKFEIPGKDLVIQATSDKISFGLYEIWGGNWKGGLQIYSAHVEEVSTIQKP